MKEGERKFTVVRATCERCGDVAIASLYCSVLIVGGRHALAFMCPGCIEYIRIGITVDIARTLVDAGATTGLGVLASQPSAPPINDSDIESFKNFLVHDFLADIAEAESDAG